MMHDSQRRRILKSVAAFFTAYGTGVSAESFSLEKPSVSEKETLAAFLDVLIPRDRITGSATDLQVDRQLWSLAESSDNFRRLLAIGCEWLNKTDSVPFSQLTYKQQYKLITWMSESDWQYVPRRFYEIVRNTSMSLYYSQPEARQGLPMHLAPQPEGYLPPWQ